MPTFSGLFRIDTSYWDATAQVSGANFTTSSGTLTNITGLTYAATANALYEIESVLKYQANIGNGLFFAVNFSAAAATGSAIFLGPNVAATAVQSAKPLATDSSAYGSVAATDLVLTVKAVVTTGVNTGNITIQVRRNVGDTATVYVGSVLKIKRLA